MTIKQQGGVFGRNPSFNDVEAEQVTTSSANIADLVVSNSSSFKGNMALRNSAGTQVAFIAPSLGGSFRFQGQSAEPMTFWINNVQVGEFNNNRDLKINNGNLVIGTSGKGIDFSATAGTGTSELFDDYEEGTYTATLTPATSGSISLSPGYNTLSYTKTGRLVTVTGMCLVGSVSSPVGYMSLSIPFAILDSDQNSGRCAGSIFATGTVAANASDFLIYGYENATHVRVFLGDATSTQADSAQEMQTNTSVVVSFSYIAA